MTAKKYLETLEVLNSKINQKIEEAEDLRIIATNIRGVDYSKENVQRTPSGEAPFVKTVNHIIDLENEINREIDKFVDEKHKMINEIHQLDNAAYIDILYKRYVKFKRLEIIAVEMNFSYDYIKHLHGDALQNFEEKILNSTPINTQ